MKNLPIALVLTSLLACTDSSDQNLNIMSDDQSQEITTTTADDNLVASLQLLREEEKLARDTYSYLYQKWGSPIFINIASSEQRHTDAVKDLLITYEIEDPVTVDISGVFASVLLQNLYDSLIDVGSISLSNALRVGAFIEEVDIRDLDNASSEISQSDVLSVYSNLNKGSRNHLRSFYKNLQSTGEDYNSQVLSDDYFNEIISSDTEKGN